MVKAGKSDIGFLRRGLAKRSRIKRSCEEIKDWEDLASRNVLDRRVKPAQLIEDNT